MQTTQQVHVKVEHAEEIRRFVLEPVSYEKLDSLLHSLFNVPAHAQLSLKFLDDENDWVMLGSDEELNHAVELQGSLLKVKFSDIGEGKETVVEEKVHIAHFTHPHCDVQEHCGRFRGRGGRGRGRGKRCGKMDRSGEDFNEDRTARLTAKIAALQAKIDSDTIPKDRLRVVNWRLEKLKGKLAGNVEGVESQETTEKSWKKDRCGPREDNCPRREIPEWRMSLKKMKSERRELQCQLRDARKEGNEETMASLKVLIELKTAEMIALKTQHMEGFAGIWEKKQALQKARQGGNEDEIADCKVALHEARFATRGAKCPNKRFGVVRKMK